MPASPIREDFTVPRHHLAKAERFTNTADPRRILRAAVSGVGTSNWCGDLHRDAFGRYHGERAGHLRAT
ncbi:MAG TPA: hypothetical protein VKA80_06460, partial [Beijerinckiaceae bacterium]|nr:hypothetical protein [Beijerinckiaceae bacterium]